MTSLVWLSMIISEMSVASFVVDMQETMADLHDKIT